MYPFLLKFHSGFRYIVLILIVIAVVQALIGLFAKKPYSDLNKKVNLFTMISMHTQLLIGLVLYFFSPFVRLNDMAAAMKDAGQRYWTVEHLVMMIFAVVLVTIGHAKSKKISSNPTYKHRVIAMFYGLAIIVILAAVYQSGRPLIGS